MSSEYSLADYVLAPTIDELSEDYDLPALAGLFNEKARGEAVMEFTGLSLAAFGIENRDCLVVFTHRDDIEDMKSGDILSGFELSLVDKETGEIYLVSYHGEIPEGSGLFALSGGGLYTGADNLETLIALGGPVGVMQFLTRLEPAYEEAPAAAPGLN